MNYLNRTIHADGSYPAPQSTPAPDLIPLTDEQAAMVVRYSGFVVIEEETDGSAQANIASVIYNRLNNTSYETAGLLQIDASLLYALPDHEGAITNEDKAVDSPYNLYKNKGLPPTPISNPGLASIQAALDPAETNYYYYALGTDGKHHFSTTLAEHNAFLASGQYAG